MFVLVNQPSVHSVWVIREGICNRLGYPASCFCVFKSWYIKKYMGLIDFDSNLKNLNINYNWLFYFILYSLSDCWDKDAYLPDSLFAWRSLPWHRHQLPVLCEPVNDMVKQRPLTRNILPLERPLWDWGGGWSSWQNWPGSRAMTDMYQKLPGKYTSPRHGLQHNGSKTCLVLLL